MGHVLLCERNLFENGVRPGVLADIFRVFSSLSVVSGFSCWNGLPLSPCSYLFVDRIIQNNFKKRIRWYHISRAYFKATIFVFTLCISHSYNTCNILVTCSSSRFKFAATTWYLFCPSTFSWLSSVTSCFCCLYGSSLFIYGPSVTTLLCLTVIFHSFTRF